MIRGVSERLAVHDDRFHKEHNLIIDGGKGKGGKGRAVGREL